MYSTLYVSITLILIATVTAGSTIPVVSTNYTSPWTFSGQYRVEEEDACESGSQFVMLLYPGAVATVSAAGYIEKIKYHTIFGADLTVTHYIDGFQYEVLGNNHENSTAWCTALSLQDDPTSHRGNHTVVIRIVGSPLGPDTPGPRDDFPGCVLQDLVVTRRRSLISAYCSLQDGVEEPPTSSLSALVGSVTLASTASESSATSSTGSLIPSESPASPSSSLIRENDDTLNIEHLGKDNWELCDAAHANGTEITIPFTQSSSGPGQVPRDSETERNPHVESTVSSVGPRVGRLSIRESKATVLTGTTL
ncbi:hypothetical protein EXIGLDRAFT_823566 [Exidia glandulosa HHB12029]|uniref:Uncharacterized protein n=1 Tax=Exidia glandulosa HHB12029 TaxID=1314781 RepID=A0A165J9N2_EXIGL|nr:hypothetical protein EXIGLDRAFT_823566 [Exidia glandulosa HHB12029]